jgi:pyruvate-formate lyase-activating enzyme
VKEYRTSSNSILKAMTPDLHRRLTGKDNQPIHEFARRLAAARKPIWVRNPGKLAVR